MDCYWKDVIPLAGNFISCELPILTGSQTYNAETYFPGGRMSYDVSSGLILNLAMVLLKFGTHGGQSY